jgi:hypothetical protein
MTILSTYLHPHNAEIDEKFHQLTVYNVLSAASFASFFHMIEGIEGDIVECGIGRSRSLVILCALLIGLRHDRRILAYDSFAGFPLPTKEDASERDPKAGEWSKSPSGKYCYTEDFCRIVLEQAEIPLDRVNLTLVKGFFEGTLPHNDSKQIALLNIDSDLYKSYWDCLENLFPKVAKGGIILFDDFPKDDVGGFPGSRLAVKKYLGESEYANIQLNKYGVYYYIKP